MKNIIISLLLILSSFASIYAADTLFISNKNVIEYDIYDILSTFVDTSNKYSITDIQNFGSNFQKHNAEGNVDFGFNKNNCWIQFSIKNNTKDNTSLLLIVSNPDINYLDFYEYKDAVQSKAYYTGELMETNSRPFLHRYFLFKLELEPNKTYTYFLRSNNQGDSNLIPLILKDELSFFKIDLRDQFFYSFIYGILLLIVGFNLYLFRITKDKVYLSYLIYVFFVIVLMLSTDGYLYFLGSPWLSNMGKILVPAFGIIYFISFSQKFLESAKKWKRLNNTLNVLKVGMLVLGVLPLIKFSLVIHSFVVGITLLFLSSFLVFIIYAFKSYNKSYLPSQYFLFAFIAMLVFALCYPLREMGLLPYNFLTVNGIRIGFTFQTILLTIAVLERFRIQQEDAKKTIEKSHKRIELQNKELEIINTELEKLSIVASETDNSVAIYDKSGRIEWCNEGFERFYETDISTLIKQKTEFIEEIIPFNNVKELFKKCVQNKEAVIFEAKLKFDDEKDKWVHTTLSPYVKGNKVIAVDTDITSLKDYEADLKLAKEKAEESDRIKTIFLSNMSHEVRTPLNGILGFSELLNSDGITDEERTRFVEIIKSNGEQLIRIIDDILDMSLIETNQLKIWNSDFSLSQLCDELVEFFEFYKITIDKSEVKLIKEFNINIESDNINSDNSRLKQVLMNLLKNGFKFTDKGYVKMSCSTNEDNILFYVEDTGIGIEPSKIDDIFKRFRQADERTTRKYGGNGLGLTISKGIIEKMGGDIWIDPEYTLGFRICFVIPLRLAKKNENKNGIDGIINEQQRSKIKNRRILIVEDDDLSYEYLHDLLEPFKIVISRATNGIDAIQEIKDNHFDIVLMDINLPELDGIEATKKIRRFNIDIPIIAQTAYAMATDESRILESGCNDVISKPINSKKLLEKIEMFF